jgi:hypothetical protein
MSKELTRRAALVAIAAGAPTLTASAPGHPDAELIELGRQYDEAAAAIEQNGADDEPWARQGAIFDAIIGMPAATIEGVRVKARVVCDGLLGDLDENTWPKGQNPLPLSIVRDLIRLYDPDRERPNAWRDLIAEIEREATKS